MKARPRPGRERRSNTPKREAFDIVLIVCEGTKTEPFYLKGLCDDLRLSSANVVVFDKASGSSPGTVVEFALEKFLDDKKFDRVFCVFDRDHHDDYNAAVERCRSLRRTNLQSVVCPFVPITSNPSFEYWIYLHFQFSTAPVAAAGGKSSGAMMLSALKAVYPDYSKAGLSLFHELRSRLPIAGQNARRVNGMDLDNPHTKMIDLVAYLAAFRRNRGIDWVDRLLN